MTRSSPETGNTIEKLLQDRAQFVSWLTRLNASGEASSAVPESVRGRVRADYERRLEAVLDELRGHTTQLEEQVDGLSARARELTVRETEHREQLSEAEVRHLVGEYDDVKWEGIRAELLKLVTHIRDELNHTTSEIERLNEVLGTIRAPVVPSPTAGPPPLTVSAPRPATGVSGPRPVVVPEHSGNTGHPEPARPAAHAQPPAAAELPFRPAQTRPAAKPATPAPAAAPKKDDQPGRTLWFPSGKAEPQSAGSTGKLDELAFLKSVTGESSPTPPASPTTQPPRRASGGFTRTAETPAVTPPAPAPAPEPPVAKAPALPDPQKDRPSQGQKTLKCGECGTLNRPTEWYCERCGAELAAL
jgi:hypothetical protein